jgi:hypothetical protein
MPGEGGVASSGGGGDFPLSLGPGFSFGGGGGLAGAGFGFSGAPSIPSPDAAATAVASFSAVGALSPPSPNESDQKPCRDDPPLFSKPLCPGSSASSSSSTGASGAANTADSATSTSNTVTTTAAMPAAGMNPSSPIASTPTLDHQELSCRTTSSGRRDGPEHSAASSLPSSPVKGTSGTSSPPDRGSSMLANSRATDEYQAQPSSSDPPDVHTESSSRVQSATDLDENTGNVPAANHLRAMLKQFEKELPTLEDDLLRLRLGAISSQQQNFQLMEEATNVFQCAQTIMASARMEDDDREKMICSPEG